jgi:hypothetical protein
MAWLDFGEGLVSAVATAWDVRGTPAGLAAVTAGEQALDCPDMPLVAAWVSAIDPEPSAIPCSYTPRVRWTVRIAHCTDDPTTWHDLLESAWCAIADYLDTCCQPAHAGLQVSYQRGTVDGPLGGVIHADLDYLVEETC